MYAMSLVTDQRKSFVGALLTELADNYTLTLRADGVGGPTKGALCRGLVRIVDMRRSCFLYRRRGQLS